MQTRLTYLPKRWRLPLTIIVCLQLPFATFAQTDPSIAIDGCTSVKASPGRISTGVAIYGFGRFCLTQDFVQREVRDVISGRIRGRPNENGESSIIGFLESDPRMAKNVDLNFQGHLVTGRPFEHTYGVRMENGAAPVRIHNGTIDTPGIRSYGMIMGRVPSAGWGSSGDGPYRRFGSEDDGIGANDDRTYDEVGRYLFRNKSKVKTYWDFKPALPDKNLIVENMTITSGGRGVVMAGAYNILRNNTIEVGSKVAVYLYGPNTLVEGNTFIIHQDKTDDADLPAVLKLRDAHNAIIRNNRFIVKNTVFRGKAPAAINLLESKDVLIENNTIEGAHQLIRTDENSTVVERGNLLKP
jgi:Right handed beta helix region